MTATSTSGTGALDRLRFRLTLWYATTLLMTLALLGGGLFLAVRRQLSSQLDASLADATAEIARAALEKRSIVVVPVAFVSEHSETLVELDLEYAELAQHNGAAGYTRVPTVGTQPEFIAGLASLVRGATDGGAPRCGSSQHCSSDWRRCVCAD